ncbi:hypothetical protein SFR_6333 [Streptomyces sp. FR-008]|nr:hypothetical protein SFR_6333 [Streptomyces sp. FR-008]
MGAGDGRPGGGDGRGRGAGRGVGHAGTVAEGAAGEAVNGRPGPAGCSSLVTGGADR